MCGLFGILTKEKVNVDKRAIATLGFVNDARGGDACGLFIDGQIEYGTEGKNVNFYNFFQQSELFKSASKANVVLGHCRKASVGGKSADKAQPIVIKEGDDIKFVLLHNGTIKNYTDLAKKYIPDVDITGLSDSQVMARIFYDAGYDCLAEYNGGAVFVTADYRTEKPEIRLWRGWSKDYSYSKEISAERPLFLVMFNNRLVFSSIGEALQCLYPDLEVKTVKQNSLCLFRDGKLYIEREFDRSNCIQTPTTSYAGSSYYGDDRDYYNGYRGNSRQYGSEKCVYDSRKSTQETKETEKEKTSLTPTPAFYSDDYYGAEDCRTDGFSNNIYCDKTFLRFYINRLNCPSSPDKYNPVNARLFHGIVKVSNLGFIRDKHGSTKVDGVFAFYNGYLLKSVSCYHYLEKLAKLWCVDFANMGNLAPYLIAAFSVYPVAKQETGVANVFYDIDPDNNFVETKANGDYPLIFTQRTVKFEDGLIASGYCATNYSDTFDAIKKQNDAYVIKNKVILSFLDTSYD